MSVFVPSCLLERFCDDVGGIKRIRPDQSCGRNGDESGKTSTIELFESEAPKSVGNFSCLCQRRVFEGTVFHRVIEKFMIQGGGMTADLSPKQTRPPIENEARNGLSNERGTVAMARTNVIDSATLAILC